MKIKKSKKSGFTLVELMVVAIIIAILVVVAIPRMSGFKKPAMGSEAKICIGVIKSAARVYLTETGAYPVDLAAITSIAASDLDGQYFDYDDYGFTSGSSNTYKIVCNGDAESGRGPDVGKTDGMSVSLDETGTWVRNY